MQVLFHAVELNETAKWKLYLIGMQHMKHSDFMPCETQVAQAVENGGDIVKAIRDEKDQAAPVHLLGNIVQQGRDDRLVGRLKVFQRLQDGLHVPRLTARR